MVGVRNIEFGIIFFIEKLIKVFKMVLEGK